MLELRLAILRGWVLGLCLLNLTACGSKRQKPQPTTSKSVTATSPVATSAEEYAVPPPPGSPPPVTTVTSNNAASEPDAGANALATIYSSITAFKKANARPPKNLDELVSSGILPSLPRPPRGKVFFYDPVEQEVSLMADR